MIAEFKPNTEGVYYDLDAEVYHKAPGLSQTMIKHLDRSPSHLQAYIGAEKTTTPDMLFGSVLHQLVLEPKKDAFWVVEPEGLDGRTKEGKAWRAANAGKTTLSTETLEHAMAAAQTIRSHPTAGQAFECGKAEVSLFSNFSFGGTVLRKARIDFVNDGPCLVDIKTTQDARPEAFARTLFDFAYHRQAAYYLDVWNALNPDQPKTSFVFIAVEKFPPYGICVYDVDADALERGRKEWTRLAGLYIECEAKKFWPCYNTEIQSLKLPPWALKKEHNDGTFWANRVM
jgi:exodeoxyribonuclease VIII